jgi:DNA-directed RNA polymerase subunit RPC12/RpoP
MAIHPFQCFGCGKQILIDASKGKTIYEIIDGKKVVKCNECKYNVIEHTSYGIHIGYRVIGLIQSKDKP